MSVEQPKPIAFFRHTLLPPSETFVLEQAARLSRFEVHFFGRERGRGEFTIPRLHLIQRAAEKRFLRRALYTATGRSGLLLAKLREVGPVLMHAHFGIDGLYALPFARALGVPLVTTFYGYDATRSRRSFLLGGKISNIRYALLQQRLRNRGDLFLAISDFIRSRIVEQGFPEDRIRVHPLGVDLSRFDRARRNDDGRTILAVGRLVPFKGTEYLVRAMALVGRAVPDARLVLVGDGPCRPLLERLAQEPGIAEKIRFRGVQPHAQVAEEMERASVFCQPSVTEPDGHAEGLGVTLLEAAAAGIPLVGTRSGAIPEVIQEGANGFLVEERNVRQLADRIVHLLNHPEHRERMGAAGRRIVEQRFNAESLAVRLEEVYGELLGGEPFARAR